MPRTVFFIASSFILRAMAFSVFDKLFKTFEALFVIPFIPFIPSATMLKALVNFLSIESNEIMEPIPMILPQSTFPSSSLK